MLEKQIEKSVCEYAKSRGLLHYKFTSPAHLGVPDRLFILPSGKIFFIEFKAPGKKPTPSQVREIGRLENYGCHVWVCDDVLKGKGIIDAYLTGGV